jgi:phosphopantetheinyl transferase (holo-ACP synthase)
MHPGVPLEPGLVQEVLGALVLAERREAGEVEVVLGPGETKLLSEMPWPHRRAEWLAGRRAAKRLLARAFDLPPERTEVLPLESGAPRVYVDGLPRAELVLNLSHTKGWAVAAAAKDRVGIDVCDDADGLRIARIARRVFSEGEAEQCGAFQSAQTQAAVWALKEAGLKLFIGGIFDPGARAIRVESLEPPRVTSTPPMRVVLLRLPDAAVAVSRDVGVATSTAGC